MLRNVDGWLFNGSKCPRGRKKGGRRRKEEQRRGRRSQAKLFFFPLPWLVACHIHHTAQKCPASEEKMCCCPAHVTAKRSLGVFQATLIGRRKWGAVLIPPLTPLSTSELHWASVGFSGRAATFSELSAEHQWLFGSALPAYSAL